MRMKYTTQKSVPSRLHNSSITYNHRLASQFVKKEGRHDSRKCGECTPDGGQGEGHRIAHAQIAVHDDLVILNSNNASQPGEAPVSIAITSKRRCVRVSHIMKSAKVATNEMRLR